MRNSFVGLISPSGLESLLPENAATRRWSLDLAKRRPTTCVWVVLEQHVATEIALLLEEHDRAAALRYLSQTAESLGPIC